MTFLERIAGSRRERVRRSQRAVPLAELKRRCEAAPRGLDPLGSLSRWPGERRAIIAEIKRRSPSKGPLRPDLDPVRVARAYEDGGAFAISVLTEPDHFGGSVEDLGAVRSAVRVPILYKDFVVHPYQLWEARAWGADLVLLIVALLGERTGPLVELSREAGLEPLVEVHDRAELETAVGAGARLVGINNRDLKTFRVDLAVTRELATALPHGVYAVSESGLRTPEDLDALAREGVDAFLIGEALVTAPDPGEALRRFVERR